ncbi:hypothetical protein [Kitasatospora sp. NPDC101183]|uniref:hypothetical protein n=1 Tax=Kitasatospora sp. NPDC101183 TaxID=3364100 RepID=UPI0037F3DD2F
MSGGPVPAPWRRRWPAWAPRAAALWAGVYAAVQLGWAVTGTTVPLTGHSVYPPALLAVLAALALAGGGACLATTRPLGEWARRVVGVVLVVVIAMLVWGTTGLPVYFVTVTTGGGIESATGLAQVLLDTAGAALLVMARMAHRRRLRGVCTRCGQAHGGREDGPLAHPAPARAPRRVRWTACLFMGGLLPWAGCKTIWTLSGNAIGVAGRDWQAVVESRASGPAKALAEVGVDVTVFAAGFGIFLLLGLLYVWGQVFPRWTLFLAGRRVPRLLPLVPAWLTGVPLMMYGYALIVLAPLVGLGRFGGFKPSPPFTTASGLGWMAEFGGLAFAGLGTGLVVAARSYAARTKPVCAVVAA